MDIRLLNEITRSIEIALKEDEVFRDRTSQACIDKGIGLGTLLLKEEGVVAGLPFLGLIAYGVDPLITVRLLGDEGTRAVPGSIAEVEGPIHSLLAMERTAINFIQHATSIASETALYVKATGGLCDILDTRKTLPGHRYLQKYAVKMGGGKNHRFHLADQILIKDNHLMHLGLEEAIKRARNAFPSKRLQVEVENEKMFDDAVIACPDAILLDNMSPDMIRGFVLRNKKKIYLEASGGIELNNIRSYAKTGVDGISVGRLTHSVRAIDMSLKIRRK
ncbi:carboxylating nicotinate-nucleotide diphosphorylase [Candidatus Neptunichlamydia sp. REUL1]|uniref:carboxylating nicotinate-nucleotide diphosphorylase n=1 Tax=Candidatus Neptunichlamydia sp. REUL1 TaxID=3064277 RepID=UPI00292E2544|nr:carboxylating nicotinate-nucleotide diphosphorylase [Candidatus Neptunochlamydia sp. REUL1]